MSYLTRKQSTGKVGTDLDKETSDPRTQTT